MKKTLLLTAFVLLLITAFLLNITPVHVPDGIDKVFHFIGFSSLATFAILVFRSFFGEDSINFFIILVLIFGGVFAGIFEISQNFIPTRSCDINDWFMNLFGIAFSCALSFLFYAKKGILAKEKHSAFNFKEGLPYYSVNMTTLLESNSFKKENEKFSRPLIYTK